MLRIGCLRSDRECHPSEIENGAWHTQRADKGAKDGSPHEKFFKNRGNDQHIQEWKTELRRPDRISLKVVWDMPVRAMRSPKPPPQVSHFLQFARFKIWPIVRPEPCKSEPSVFEWAFLRCKGLRQAGQNVHSPTAGYHRSPDYRHTVLVHRA